MSMVTDVEVSAFSERFLFIVYLIPEFSEGKQDAKIENKNEDEGNDHSDHGIHVGQDAKKFEPGALGQARRVYSQCIFQVDSCWGKKTTKKQFQFKERVALKGPCKLSNTRCQALCRRAGSI